jgi:protein-S-isoprenylcysteine O-methyltransferase Ste14
MVYSLVASARCCWLAPDNLHSYVAVLCFSHTAPLPCQTARILNAPQANIVLSDEIASSSLLLACSGQCKRLHSSVVACCFSHIAPLLCRCSKYVLQALGHDGVYYGFKLGKVIPWVNGYPFDIVPHPQYFGSVMTVWGMVALVWSQAPQAALVIMAGYWTLVYVVTALQEQYL